MSRLRPLTRRLARWPTTALPRLALSVALGIGLAAAAARAADDRDAILGGWTGTSLCTDREVAPACKDEQIRYRFEPIEDKPAIVRLKADRLVEGEWAPMGEIELAYDATAKSWSGEVKFPRFHGIWSYALAGEKLSGTLVDVPSKATVRRVTAFRE